MPRSRKAAWLRDEIILALDLYRREGRNPTHESAIETSGQLRAMPIEQHLADNPQFRNPAAVKLKVANFVALDPDALTKGMSRGSRLDQEVFSDFAGNNDRLDSTASAIRANLRTAAAADPDIGFRDDDDLDAAPEGRILTRVHRYRERSSKLSRRKKQDALDREGRLACEACGLDFNAVYGDRGSGFMECHHVIPLRDLKPGSETKLADLALVCANCHRMIHARIPWLSIDELRERLQGQSGEETR